MTDRSQLRLVVLGVLVISLVATLLGRLWYLQVLNGKQYANILTQTQTRTVVTQPARGEIVDDMGRPLVDNKTALVVSVNRLTLEKQADGGKAVLTRLSKLLHKPYALLNNETQVCGPAANGQDIKAPCWTGSPYQPVPVSEAKPTVHNTEIALEIQSLGSQFPGVSFQYTPVRSYPRPFGANASTILGYLGPISESTLKKLKAPQQAIQLGSVVGVTGLEASYEKELHGTPGVRKISVNNVGTITGTQSSSTPVAGDDIVTNIDAKAQATLEQTLQSAINSARAAGHTADYAAGVVLNARTGGVVAMASNPTYEVNHAPPTLTGAQYKKLLHTPGHPLLDKAFDTAAAPGSTYKLISSSGLLHDGTINTGGLYDCPTYFQGKHNFDIEQGRGAISLEDALVVSCDTFFFKLGFDDWRRDQRLIANGEKPVEGEQAMARSYGMDENPGIDLPTVNESYGSNGFIEGRKEARTYWLGVKKQYCLGATDPNFTKEHQKQDRFFCHYGYEFLGGDQENEEIGQGQVLVTPLQLAVAYAAMANGGTVFEPRVVKAIVSPSGKVVKRIKAPVRGHLPLSQSQLDYLRNAFYGVVTNGTLPGTAYGLYHSANFPLSQVAVGGKTGTAEIPHSNGQDGSWFVSFAGPAGQAPQYVTVIEVNKADQGAISAAPSSIKIWDALYGLQGHKAIFPNGVPPTKLPTVGLKALNQQLDQAARNAHHTSPSPSTSGSPSSGSSPTGTPSSPSLNAAGLPPALPVNARRRAPA